MSRYLVTGATGFLGTHLVDQLLAGGHEVVALCRSDSSEARALAGRGVTVARGDILDGASVRAAAAGAGDTPACAGVFHCAGKVSRRREDAAELYRVHVEGTKITLDACREAGVRRAVLASTSGVSAVSRDPSVIDETADPPMEIIASWPYYRSKLYAERAGLDRSGPGFEVIAVGPSLLLGPGDVHGSSTGDVTQFLEQKVPVVPAGGLSFVDARDAAAGMILAMEKGRAGERYLLGAANMTLEAFFGRLARISGVQAPKLRLPRSIGLAKAGAQILERLQKHLPVDLPLDPVSAEMGQHYWYVDSAKARRELGWTSRDPLATLADTIDDLRARGLSWPTV
ncbi:NAD-dependent epimerase/dehydratase family protein [Chondromyces apiculatus]|uniref:Dihydroflavonol-4-reductase n=1 Tax=Chondromyces apiculatus DSM 436 TaxID=1192034 RepID=A0A017TBT4_9BACT|nr:NAD-dependent epimerase/dehydratase family protein [Chondromyces apiculatus]EYF06285.1 Dihydroflavonol-4-reductase [Chondromyces apiculatus DSM 436]